MLLLSTEDRVLSTEEFWRRGRDLNPRYPFGYVRFRGGSFQPLTHLSAPSEFSIQFYQAAIRRCTFKRVRNTATRFKREVFCRNCPTSLSISKRWSSAFS